RHLCLSKNASISSRHGTEGCAPLRVTAIAAAAWASVNGEGQRVPGFRVPAVDTIAAGDTFNGALITAL
ncbi:PfkB family carbohydrate kinase, partial [Escherichia coli]|uniref:PfkB family carbohydrate kinase n=1 Tax=Escherichia coli TaxID=562 RepID=UPI003EE194D2